MPTACAPRAPTACARFASTSRTRHSIDAARDDIAATMGERGIVGLVNNAGIGRGGPIEFLPLDEWRDAVRGQPLRHDRVDAGLHAAHPQRPRPHRHHRLDRRARVVAVHRPLLRLQVRARGLHRSLRFELKPWNLDVAIVEPGSIATPIWDKAEDTVAASEARAPRRSARDVRRRHRRRRGLHERRRQARHPAPTRSRWPSSTPSSPSARRPATSSATMPASRPPHRPSCRTASSTASSHRSSRSARPPAPVEKEREQVAL